MRIGLEEQETVIRIGRTESKAEICTSDSRYMTKFDRLCRESPDWEFIRQETSKGDVVEKFYRCPVKLISFRSRVSGGRTMTEEQKKKLREWRERKRQNT